MLRNPHLTANKAQFKVIAPHKAVATLKREGCIHARSNEIVTGGMPGRLRELLPFTLKNHSC